MSFDEHVHSFPLCMHLELKFLDHRVGIYSALTNTTELRRSYYMPLFVCSFQGKALICSPMLPLLTNSVPLKRSLTTDHLSSVTGPTLSFQPFSVALTMKASLKETTGSEYLRRSHDLIKYKQLKANDFSVYFNSISFNKLE